MLKYIKIIDETGNKIEPVNNQIVLPFGDEKKFISVEMAEGDIFLNGYIEGLFFITDLEAHHRSAFFQ